MIKVIILGILQGITEFLPISSSAHLILAREIFNISLFSKNIELTFDLALHFGTLLAIIVYFWTDLWNILISGITRKNKMLYYIFIATIPAALAGVLLEDIVDNFFRKQINLIAIALIIMGIIIYLTDKKNPDSKSLDKIKYKDALLIGISQIFALIPGFSRSGTTISAARSLHLNKTDSAKFSFYLSVPIVLGASIFTLIKENTITIISENLNLFGLGILVSFITGLICISFLLKYINKNDFKIFMIYRILLGIIILLK